MINIKKYAESKGTSYEAVRKQVARYRDELGDHITMQGKTQFLDDDAVAFLDEKRAESPVVVYEQNREDTVKQLTEENRALLLQLSNVQQQLIAAQQQLMQAASQIADTAMMQKLLDAKDVTVDEQRRQITDEQEKIAQLEADIAAQRDAAAAESEKMRQALDAKEAENREQAERIAALTTIAAAREDRLERMKKRGLLARLLNRDEI